jgi:hypothetical protein
MGWPNCWRSLAYFTLASKAPLAIPKLKAAMLMRPPSRIFIACWKPSPSLPRIFSSGHAAILEDHFRGLAGAHAELVLLLTGFHTGCSAFDHEGGHALAVQQIAGAHDGHDHIAALAVGDPALGAVQHPLLSLLLGRALHAHGVAAGVGFGECPCSQPFTGGQFGEPLLLLLVRCRSS